MTKVVQALTIAPALLVAACGGGSGGTAAKSPEAARGEDVFNRVCSSCHVISNENLVGPGLRGVVGRKVASVPGYDYSDAIKKDRAQNWSPERLQSYLMGPLNMYPEGRMAITPLSPEEAKATVAYLKYRQDGE